MATAHGRMYPFSNYPDVTYATLRAAHFWSGFATAVVGAAFLVLAVFLPDVMSPVVYGDFAYSIPAEMWALCWMSCGSAIMVATTKNGEWKRSALIKAFGHFSIVLLFSMVAGSAVSAEHGAHIVAFSVVFFVPLHSTLAISALREHKAKRSAVFR